MKVTYGEHALVVMAERLLSESWVEAAICAPDQVELDPKHPERVRVFRSIAERDGRVLRVVYVPTKDGVHVVPAFLDRSRRRPP